MEPLNDLIKKHGVDTSVFNKAMIEGMTVDGKIYALPYDAEPCVMFYNRQSFKTAGLKEPTTKYTYTQFLSDMKALTAGGKVGMAIKPNLMDNAPRGIRLCQRRHRYRRQGQACADLQHVRLIRPESL